MPLKYRAKFEGKWYEVLTIDLTTQTVTIPIPDLKTGVNTNVAFGEGRVGRGTEIFDAYGRELYIGDWVLAPVIETDKPGTEDPEATCIFSLHEDTREPSTYNTFRKWQYPKAVAYVDGKMTLPDGQWGVTVNAHLWLYDTIFGTFGDKPLSLYEMNPENGFLKNVRALRNDDRVLPEYVRHQDYGAWLSGAMRKDVFGDADPEWIDFSKLPLPEKKKEPRIDTVVQDE